VSRSPELLEQARGLLAARLTAKSFAHCERVAATAVTLARRFGVDVGDAELAGLLHDYARDESQESLLRLADELGVPTIPFEREHPYLLHACVGSAMARKDLPGVGEAVLSAIAVHTVGGLPMSDLDRVVYLADMIEPARTFPDVEVVRAACEAEDLAECFRVGYGRSVRYLMEARRPLHPISAAVGDRLERETGRPLFDPPEVRKK
jgi:predicted HD superfamily hydrolase involved in NAD metabolism